MASLIIKQLEYRGDNYHYLSPELSNGLNILEGDNQSGKSTFMDLIYFGLSGNPSQFKKNEKGRHSEIANDTNNYVKLSILIDGSHYILKRFIGSNEITIISSESEVLVFPIFRGKNNKITFSDWLLNNLDIDLIEIYQGHQNWMLNFLDLARLIYHDQEPNPKKVYKTPESVNFVTDSELIRKIIFQMLIGKKYSEYYLSISEFKKIESDLKSEKRILEGIQEKVQRLTRDSDSLNLIHLRKQREEYIDQLERLKKSRKALKANRPKDLKNFKKVEEKKSEYLDLDLAINKIESKINDLSTEGFKYRQLQESLIREATQIQKIIHTHEELNLFTPDTCPYCLRSVNRDHGKCVCGQDIDEEEYEKFFYSSEEYLQILKTKKKSVETVNEALNSLLEETKKLEAEQKELEYKKVNITTDVQEMIGEIEGSIDVESLNEIDDKILEVRSNLSDLDNQIEIELELDRQQNKVDALQEKYLAQKREMKSLEIKAEDDISSKVRVFNEKYKELMVNTLKDCKTARIEEDTYMPILNDGEYTAASVSVPIRLNYYLTLLYLSLSEEDVKYPKFLMVDTPQTAGIDRDNLIRCIAQIDNVANIEEDNFQIILTTKEDTFPKEYKKYVFGSLTQDNKLLNKVESN
ncbi:hypothetical protein ACKGJO_00950 [Gracilimonas sp. Q87]|uniref:hypothetical protein n=1 Tax=Gracilimonas sp. Q87 TaxID=3384766 RepID=UPI00398413BD